MGSRVLHCSMFFLSILFLISEASIAEKPPSEAIQQKRELENQILFSSLKFTTQRDSTPTIPIIIPTTPSSPTTTPSSPITTTPSSPTTMTPIVTSPPPPATTQPSPTTTQPSPTTTPASSGGSWCIASPSASETALQVALDYACGYGGADCSAIQPGASCYNPNTLHDHASYAFNNYYQKNPSPTSCVFGGTAQLTNTDPSSGSCHFAMSTTTPSTTSSNSPPSSMNSPPPPGLYTSPTTPSSSIYPGTPSVPTDYGAEPTGTPNSAYSASLNLLLIITTSCFSILAANYL
ncbi:PLASMODESMATA CALLOSE-BINDING PROTEIN 2-like [Cornus florida]|uniref:PLASMODESMATA CALLOSE-BINDING PROTEIN 2-like n=1 Tax=Cornus florida TaxID=4283 RepID=UPI00289C024C|nr:PLASMODESMATA CALLOSE-BINDING PROTEIN 2-like [Cornus florida]